jgi:ribonuclease HII
VSARRRRDAGPGLFAEPLEPAPPVRTARVVAGIDEAGLGPLLGPLALGFSAFRSSEHALWPALAAVATQEPREDDEKLVVADSKLVFTRDPRGERRLELTALAFLSLAGTLAAPRTGAQLFQNLPAELAAERPWSEEHWFAHLPSDLPWAAQRGELVQRQVELARALESAGIELLEAGFRALPVAELNRSFDATQSKGRTQWEKTLPVLARLWQRHASEGLDLVVDRQGGRMRYKAPLEQAFPRARVRVTSENETLSEYLVEEPAGPRWMRVRFAVQAENLSFPVALASCIAKYARETCMRAFNASFAALEPALVPTAGYVTDARRWLRDAKGVLARSGIEHNELVRAR